MLRGDQSVRSPRASFPVIVVHTTQQFAEADIESVCHSDQGLERRHALAAPSANKICCMPRSLRIASGFVYRHSDDRQSVTTLTDAVSDS
jgi:hypothetical protein